MNAPHHVGKLRARSVAGVDEDDATIVAAAATPDVAGGLQAVYEAGDASRREAGEGGQLAGRDGLVPDDELERVDVGHREAPA